MAFSLQKIAENRHDTVAVVLSCSVKKVLLKISESLRKDLCWSFLSNKVEESGTLLKKRLRQRFFSFNFAKCLRKCILKNVYKQYHTSVFRTFLTRKSQGACGFFCKCRVYEPIKATD